MVRRKVTAITLSEQSSLHINRNDQSFRQSRCFWVMSKSARRLKHFQFLKLPDLFSAFTCLIVYIRLLRYLGCFCFLWVGLEALRPWGLASTPHVPCLGNLAAVCGPSVICHCQSSSSPSSSSSSSPASSSSSSLGQSWPTADKA